LEPSLKNSCFPFFSITDDSKAAYYETDIPIITDAEVVEAEVVAVNVPQSALPPPRNPNYLAPAIYTTAAPPAGKTFSAPYPLQQLPQQQQQYPSSQLPISVHVNTAMVGTVSTTLKSPRTIKTLGRNATGLLCPHCQRQTVTVVEDYVGLGTVIAVIILAILFWPVCWLPLCVPTCRRTHHYCGHISCQKKVGETRVCA
jgi:hypothetical protein